METIHSNTSSRLLKTASGEFQVVRTPPHSYMIVTLRKNKKNSYNRPHRKNSYFMFSAAVAESNDSQLTRKESHAQALPQPTRAVHGKSKLLEQKASDARGQRSERREWDSAARGCLPSRRVFFVRTAASLSSKRTLVYRTLLRYDKSHFTATTSYGVTDNVVRCPVLPLSMRRVLYRVASCKPATQRCQGRLFLRAGIKQRSSRKLRSAKNNASRFRTRSNPRQFLRARPAGWGLVSCEERKAVRRNSRNFLLSGLRRIAPLRRLKARKLLDKRTATPKAAKIKLHQNRQHSVRFTALANTLLNTPYALRRKKLRRALLQARCTARRRLVMRAYNRFVRVSCLKLRASYFKGRPRNTRKSPRSVRKAARRKTQKSSWSLLRRGLVRLLRRRAGVVDQFSSAPLQKAYLREHKRLGSPLLTYLRKHVLGPVRRCGQIQQHYHLPSYTSRRILLSRSPFAKEQDTRQSWAGAYYDLFVRLLRKSTKQRSLLYQLRNTRWRRQKFCTVRVLPRRTLSRTLLLGTILTNRCAVTVPANRFRTPSALLNTGEAFNAAVGPYSTSSLFESRHLRRGILLIRKLGRSGASRKLHYRAFGRIKYVRRGWRKHSRWLIRMFRRSKHIGWFIRKPSKQIQFATETPARRRQRRLTSRLLRSTSFWWLSRQQKTLPVTVSRRPRNLAPLGDAGICRLKDRRRTILFRYTSLPYQGRTLPRLRLKLSSNRVIFPAHPRVTLFWVPQFKCFQLSRNRRAIQSQPVPRVFLRRRVARSSNLGAYVNQIFRARVNTLSFVHKRCAEVPPLVPQKETAAATLGLRSLPLLVDEDAPITNNKQ